MDLAATLIVALLAASVYLNCLHGEVIMDGLMILGSLQPFQQAKARSSLRAIWRLPKFGRSLTYWTYFRDLAAHGIEPDGKATEREKVAGWHARDIALHAVNATLIFAMLRWWFSPVEAALGASFFAVHPLGSSTVPSIAGRSSLLCMAFFLATILAFLGGWWVLIPLLAWCGWRSKEEYIAVVPTLAVVWWFR